MKAVILTLSLLFMFLFGCGEDEYVLRSNSGDVEITIFCESKEIVIDPTDMADAAKLGHMHIFNAQSPDYIIFYGHRDSTSDGHRFFFSGPIFEEAVRYLGRRNLEISIRPEGSNDSRTGVVASFSHTQIDLCLQQ